MILQDIKDGIYNRAKFLRSEAVARVNAADTVKAMEILAQVKELEDVGDSLRHIDGKCQIDRSTLVSLLTQQAGGNKANFFVWDSEAGMLYCSTAIEAKRAADDRLAEFECDGDADPSTLCWGILFGKTIVRKADNSGTDAKEYAEWNEYSLIEM